MVGKNDFNKIYTEFHSRILHYISRLTNNIEAEDITQEVFEKVSRGLKGFRGESRISTWVYRIATNTALDRIRSQSFSTSSEELTPDVNDINIWSGQRKTPVDQSLIRKEMSECVREYIDRLSPEYRTVILLSEFEGFKNREIAEILNISLDTAKIRLHRARASLKKELDEGCSFYHNEQDILACDRKASSVMEFRSSNKNS